MYIINVIDMKNHTRRKHAASRRTKRHTTTRQNKKHEPEINAEEMSHSQTIEMNYDGVTGKLVIDKTETGKPPVHMEKQLPLDQQLIHDFLGREYVPPRITAAAAKTTPIIIIGRIEDGHNEDRDVVIRGGMHTRKNTISLSKRLITPISKRVIRSPREASKRARRANHFQCQMFHGEGENPPKYYMIDIDTQQNKELHAHLPVITNPKSTAMGDGVYAWLLMGEDNAHLDMHATKVLNVQEFGSKHVNIVDRVMEKGRRMNVYYAGELKKKGESIEFNLLSGSFMQGKLKHHEMSHAIAYVKDYLERRMLDGDTSGKVKYVDETFITQDKMPITEEDLELYKRIGARILAFNKKEDCIEYSNMRRYNPAAADRMHDKYTVLS